VESKYVLKGEIKTTIREATSVFGWGGILSGGKVPATTGVPLLKAGGHFVPLNPFENLPPPLPRSGALLDVRAAVVAQVERGAKPAG
jgi:hypothetical protein